jgi:hypothetical protein
MYGFFRFDGIAFEKILLFGKGKLLSHHAAGMGLDTSGNILAFHLRGGKYDHETDHVVLLEKKAVSLKPLCLSR